MVPIRTPTPRLECGSRLCFGAFRNVCHGAGRVREHHHRSRSRRHGRHCAEAWPL